MSSSRETRSRTLTGIAAAPGLAAGPAAVWRDQTVTVPRNSGRQPATETARLTAARAAARDEIRRLRAKVAAEAGQAEAAIFDAHEMFLDDTALLQHAQQAIETGVNAEAAWADAIEFFAAQLEQLPDPTLRAHVAHIGRAGPQCGVGKLLELRGEEFDGVRPRRLRVHAGLDRLLRVLQQGRVVEEHLVRVEDGSFRLPRFGRHLSTQPANLVARRRSRRGQAGGLCRRLPAGVPWNRHGLVAPYRGRAGGQSGRRGDTGEGAGAGLSRRGH